jgi:hypothetical protein
LSQKVNWTLQLLLYADEVKLLGNNVGTMKRRYVTSRKVAGSIPDEVIDICQFSSSLQPDCGPGVYSASNRNEFQDIFLGVGG